MDGDPLRLAIESFVRSIRTITGQSIPPTAIMLFLIKEIGYCEDNSKTVSDNNNIFISEPGKDAHICTSDTHICTPKEPDLFDNPMDVHIGEGLTKKLKGVPLKNPSTQTTPVGLTTSFKQQKRLLNNSISQAIDIDMTTSMTTLINKNSIELIHTIIDYWNNKQVLKKVNIISKSRRARFRERLKEADFRNNWKKIVDKTADSAFLRGELSGEKGPHRNWRATIDWILVNDKNYVKVLEGNYDDHKDKFDKYKRGYHV